MTWHFNAGGIDISIIDKDMADHSSAINDNTQMPSPRTMVKNDGRVTQENIVQP